jgi:hypothetical protein
MKNNRFSISYGFMPADKFMNDPLRYCIGSTAGAMFRIMDIAGIVMSAMALLKLRSYRTHHD